MSVIGRIRDNNEDNFFWCGEKLSGRNEGLWPPKSCWIDSHQSEIMAIFDGMGGCIQGETEAYIAAQTLCKQVKACRIEVAPESLKTAGEEISNAVFQRGRAFASCGMEFAMAYTISGREPRETVLEVVADNMRHLPGDRFLACSDGLTDMVSEMEISDVFKSAVTAEAAMEPLVCIEAEHGGIMLRL